jgi:hypothetical protein
MALKRTTFYALVAHCQHAWLLREAAACLESEAELQTALARTSRDLYDSKRSAAELSGKIKLLQQQADELQARVSDAVLKVQEAELARDVALQAYHWQRDHGARTPGPGNTFTPESRFEDRTVSVTPTETDVTAVDLAATVFGCDVDDDGLPPPMPKLSEADVGSPGYKLALSSRPCEGRDILSDPFWVAAAFPRGGVQIEVDFGLIGQPLACSEDDQPRPLEHSPAPTHSQRLEAPANSGTHEICGVHPSAGTPNSVSVQTGARSLDNPEGHVTSGLGTTAISLDHTDVATEVSSQDNTKANSSNAGLLCDPTNSVMDSRDRGVDAAQAACCSPRNTVSSKETLVQDPVAQEAFVQQPVQETEVKEPEAQATPVVEPAAKGDLVVEPVAQEAPDVEPEAQETPVVEPAAPVIEPVPQEAPVVEPGALVQQPVEKTEVQEPAAPVVEPGGLVQQPVEKTEVPEPAAQDLGMQHNTILAPATACSPRRSPALKASSFLRTMPPSQANPDMVIPPAAPGGHTGPEDAWADVNAVVVSSDDDKRTPLAVIDSGKITYPVKVVPPAETPAGVRVMVTSSPTAPQVPLSSSNQVVAAVLALSDDQAVKAYRRTELVAALTAVGGACKSSAKKVDIVQAIRRRTVHRKV